MQRLMIGDKVLLKRLAPKGITDGGILIPEQQQIPQDFAVVIAVGPGNIKGDGNRSTMTALVGDMVPLPKRVFGQPLEVDEVDYIICREFEIPMLLREDDEEVEILLEVDEEKYQEDKKKVTQE